MAIVERRGLTASAMVFETRDVSIFRGLNPDRISYDVTVNFVLKSKGGGKTRVLVHLAPSDFPALATTMLRADPDAAIRAFGEAMMHGLPSPE